MKLKKDLTQADIDDGNTIQITNNSGSFLSVLNSFNTSNLESSSLYENTLTLLPTVDGEKRLSEKQTAAFKLTGNTFTTRAGEVKPGFLYNLLFVDPDTLNPIGNSTVSNLEGSYPPISVTERQRKQMALARKFYQRILAYPTSQLAKGFFEALKTARESRELSVLDTYFQQGLDAYRELDFSSVMMEMSYMSNYAGFWVENQEKCTFYLYNSSDTTDEQRAQTDKFIGTSEFTKSSFSSNAIDVRKAYAIVFKDERGSSHPVGFVRGFFRSSDTDLSLAPVLMPQSKLGEDLKDDKMTAALVGQIDGMKILGLTKVPTPTVLSEVVNGRDLYYFILLGAFVGGVLLSLSRLVWWLCQRAQGGLVSANPPQTDEETGRELDTIAGLNEVDIRSTFGDSIFTETASFIFTGTASSLVWDRFQESFEEASMRTTCDMTRIHQLECVKHLREAVITVMERVGTSSKKSIEDIARLQELQTKLEMVSERTPIPQLKELLGAGDKVIYGFTKRLSEIAGALGAEFSQDSRLRRLINQHDANIAQLRELVDRERVEEELFETRESLEVEPYCEVTRL